MLRLVREQPRFIGLAKACIGRPDKHMKTPHQWLFSQYPLVQMAVAYSAGLLSSSYLQPRLSIIVTLYAVCSAVAVVATLRKRIQFAGVSLLLAAFFAGSLLFTIQRGRNEAGSIKHLITEYRVAPDEVIELTGILSEQPTFARRRAYLTLRVESARFKECELPSSGLVSLLVASRDEASDKEYRNLRLHYGTRIRVKTTVTRTDKYRNPGVSTLTEYLDRKGYDATGYVKSPWRITRFEDTRVFPPLAWLYSWRERLQQQVDMLFSIETAGVLDAALLGNRYNLSRLTTERFRQGGTFHVLVISGLHISFLGGFVFLASKWLSNNRLMQFAFSSGAIWAYALAVGGGASVVRAALMFSCVTFATVVFRSASSLNALGGATLALLVHSPKDVFDPSLQLTVLSVSAIVVVAWPMLERLSAVGNWRPTRSSPYPPSCSRRFKAIAEILFWKEREWKKEVSRFTHHYRVLKAPAALWLERFHIQAVLRYVFGAVVISGSVQLVLLPLLIVYFHRVSMASVVLNIVVGAVLAMLAAVSLAALLLSLVSGTLAMPLVHCASAINWLLVHIVDPFQSLGIASMRIPEYSGWAQPLYVIYFIPLILLAVKLNNWNPLGPPLSKDRTSRNGVTPALITQVGLVAVLLLHPLSARRADGKLHVDFLDVGQGDSALVTMPGGATLLVDGGGRPNFLNGPVEVDGAYERFEPDARSIGETVVSEYLWWRGLDTVDYVLVTHADADHIDGLNDVVRNFSVRAAFVARTPANDVEYSKFAQSLADTGTNLTVLQAGDRWLLDGVDTLVLWPPPGLEVAPSHNNDSLVIRLQFGAQAILLTGDIEKGAETALVKESANLSADVVKVPHHGSKTSSTEEFVNATRPEFAIISVGQTSMFGHPHREVVDRWRASGAQVLTTGGSGTITVKTDGKQISVTRFLSE